MVTTTTYIHHNNHTCTLHQNSNNYQITIIIHIDIIDVLQDIINALHQTEINIKYIS